MRTREPLGMLKSMMNSAAAPRDFKGAILAKLASTGAPQLSRIPHVWL